MPKVLETIYGITVYIYFKDHNPPHVHVYYGDAGSHEASMTLEIGTWEILEVNGFSQKDVKKVIGELRKQ
jgi:hypothetical protein